MIAHFMNMELGFVDVIVITIVIVSILRMAEILITAIG
jgi:hypothetical protein